MKGQIWGQIPSRIGEQVPLFLDPAPVTFSGSGENEPFYGENISPSHSAMPALRYESHDMPDAPIILGTRADSKVPPAAVICDHWQLSNVLPMPWFQDYVLERHRVRLASPKGQKTGSAFSVPASFLAPPEGADRPARHAVCVGSSGSGKTRFLLKLLSEQLRLGCSAVVLDFKPDTLQRALHCALEAGVPGEDIVAVMPDATEGIPGWNPFAVGERGVRQAAAQFADVVEAAGTNRLTKSKDLLVNAVTVVAAQGLSVLEMERFLEDEAYREALLEEARRSGTYARFRREHRFFEAEYARWSESQKAEGLTTIMNKCRPLVSDPFLSGLLSAPEDTLDLPSLWHRQRVVLVHLTELTEMLAGFLVRHLQKAAGAGNGPVPVVLVLDELKRQEELLGDALTHILTFARSQNLRLLCACQFLGQLGDELRKSVVGNTAVQAYFRLEEGDAGKTGAAIVQGEGRRPVLITLEPKQTEHSIFHRVTDGAGMAVSIPDWSRWDALNRAPDRITRLRRMALESGKALYCGGQLLWNFLDGLPPSCWRFWGPTERPLYVEVFFPVPNVRVEWKSETEAAAETAARLKKFPDRHAVLKVAGRATAYVETAPLPLPGDPGVPGELPDIGAYVSGRSAEEVERYVEGLERRMDELAGTVPAAPRKTPGKAKAAPAPRPLATPDYADWKEKADDGSL